MITKISGRVVRLGDDFVAIEAEPFEYQVLIPEFVRRQMQSEEGKPISLHTIDYLEGNPMQGRLTPRLIGFVTDAERAFFELFCSVDGVGVRKALRALVRPIKEIAVAIEEQDAKALATLPGIGEATAERIIAKLRRKVSKFALMVAPQGDGRALPARDVVEDAHKALVSVGHSPADARRLLDAVLTSGKKYKDAGELIERIYQLQNQGE
jgi:Holliday junction DNA helicase RuvA